MAEAVQPIGVADDAAENTLIVSKEDESHLARNGNCYAQSAAAAEKIDFHVALLGCLFQHRSL